MSPVLTIAHLTLREAQRRRILWVAILMSALFLIVFGLGLHFIVREFEKTAGEFSNNLPAEIPATLSTMGLYVTNFLVVITAVLISVAAISGEIESHVIDVVVTKPIYRWQIVLGKWLGFTAMTLTYTLILAGGVMLLVYWRTGFKLNHIPAGLALLGLNAVIMISLTLAGGTRLSTLANGILAFMLYGVAFIGGWVENIGALLRNETAVNLGIVASLIVPIEALWRKAALLFQPRLLSNMALAGPFAVGSEPSAWMIVYGILYLSACLAFAIRTFTRRNL